MSYMPQHVQRLRGGIPFIPTPAAPTRIPRPTVYVTVTATPMSLSPRMELNNVWDNGDDFSAGQSVSVLLDTCNLLLAFAALNCLGTIIYYCLTRRTRAASGRGKWRAWTAVSVSVVVLLLNVVHRVVLGQREAAGLMQDNDWAYMVGQAVMLLVIMVNWAVMLSSIGSSGKYSSTRSEGDGKSTDVEKQLDGGWNADGRMPSWVYQRFYWLRKGNTADHDVWWGARDDCKHGW